MAFVPLSRILCAIVLFFGLALPASAAERRVAFVVGNSAYKNVPVLPNPASDAQAVAKALKKSGFEVISAVDLDQASFEVQFESFIRSMKGADVSLFYYSGHGIQVNGDNRVIPIDADLSAAADLEIETVSVRSIVSYMKQNSKTQLLYLDACRNNPFPSSKFLVGADSEVGLTNVGLAASDGELGSLVAFSTQPGAVAIDGTDDNSPFTKSFLQQSFRLGIDVEQAFASITEDVWAATQERQRPWLASGLTDPIFLRLPVISISAPEVAVADGGSQSIQVGSAPQQGEGLAESASDDATQLASLLNDKLAEPKRFPMGVGPIAMLEDVPIVRAGNEAIVTLAQAPDNGVIYLDGKPFVEGSSIPQSALATLSFEPSLNSEGQVSQFLFRVGANAVAGAEVTGKIENFTHTCDTLAAEPYDIQGAGRGVALADLKASEAISACSAAVGDYPSVPRFRFQLARAHLAEGDVDQAMASLQRAAEAGHVRATFQLGYLAQQGTGMKRDPAKANELFQLASDKGDPFAMASLGQNLVKGIGIEKNAEKGVQLLNKSVELGYSGALAELGTAYLDGGDVKANEERGVKYLEAGLARNHAPSLRKLGVAYRDGQGVKKNPRIAQALLRRAVQRGEAEAPRELGKLYLNDWSGRNSCSGVEWFELAARRGDRLAALELGKFFTEGPKQARDGARAVEYYALSAAIDPENGARAQQALEAFPTAIKQKAAKSLKAEADTAVALIAAAKRRYGVGRLGVSLNQVGIGIGPRARFVEEAADRELGLWTRIEADGGVADYRDYLTRFPDGMFAEQALQRFQKTGGDKALLPGSVMNAIKAADFLEKRDLVPWRRDAKGSCEADAKVVPAALTKPTAIAPAKSKPPKLAPKQVKPTKVKTPVKPSVKPPVQQVIKGCNSNVKGLNCRGNGNRSKDGGSAVNNKGTEQRQPDKGDGDGPKDPGGDPL
jgi:TPR repeat protein